ncbi:hypothetical protein E3N88_09860 [Mikania micrantha]|uniref:Uncharacterized protein n=1 Tax=Mikania micrantha TaxID=192012 RepID=A0A5N6PKC8_9ASTR|nr:hypothetical protein E3N88_09860 [Mikania micrantha]
MRGKFVVLSPSSPTLAPPSTVTTPAASPSKPTSSPTKQPVSASRSGSYKNKDGMNTNVFTPRDEHTKQASSNGASQNPMSRTHTLPHFL